MALRKQFPYSPACRRAEPCGPGRAPLSRAERGAVQVVAVALAGFGIWGFVAGSPSTVGYVLSVLVIGAAIVWLRRAALPGLLAIALAVAAIVHLAGGLINVGHNVLYNAAIGFVTVFACWVMLAAPHAAADHRRELVILAVGAALGLGALNEVAEFAATLAHHGAHAGGYWNTGWDLACNLIGAGAAGLVIARSHASAA